MLHNILNITQPPLSSKQLETILERKNELEMIDTMKAILQQAFNDSPPESYIFPIIKNVSPSQNKLLKRLVHLFWPLVPFYDSHGALKPYSILICNSILSDLKHPNEFIQISALRCVASLEVRKVVSNVVQGIPLLLTSNFDIVRNAAAFTMTQIEKKFPGLIAIDTVEKQIKTEQNQEVLSWLVKFLAINNQPILNASLPTLLDLKPFTDNYKLGASIFDSFSSFNESNQSYLLNLTNDPQSIHPIVLSSAGLALTSYPLNSALCLLNSCKDAPEAAVLQVITTISSMNFTENQHVIAQQFTQFFLSNQSNLSIFKLLKSKILINFAENDAESARIISQALCSSKIVKTKQVDLLSALLSSVLKCGNFDGFKLSFLADVLGVCGVKMEDFELVSSQASQLEQIVQECCENCRKLIIEVSKDQPEKSAEIQLICFKSLVNSANLSGFQCILKSLTGNSKDFKDALSGLLFLLPVEHSDDFTQLLVNSLKKSENDEISVFQSVRAGKYSTVTKLLFQFTLQLIQQDVDKNMLPKLIIGLSNLLNASKDLTKLENTFCMSILQEVFTFAKTGKRSKLAQKQVKQQGILLEKPVHQQTISECASLNFSIFHSTKVAKSLEITRKNENFVSLAANPQNVQKIIQLSADADMIYCEAIPVITKNSLILHVLFINRTDAPITDLELELFANNSIIQHNNNKKLSVEPQMQIFTQYNINIKNSESTVIYGNLNCKIQQKAKQRFRDLILRISEIRIPVSQFLRPFDLSESEFSREFQTAEFEGSGKTNLNLNQINEKLNGKIVQNLDCDMIKTGFISCISVQNELVMVSFNQVEGCKNLKVKGGKESLVKSVMEEVCG